MMGDEIMVNSAKPCSRKNDDIQNGYAIKKIEHLTGTHVTLRPLHSTHGYIQKVFDCD